MAKRKNPTKRKVGLQPNNLCPHCNQKVKLTHYILPDGKVAGYFVERWWTDKVCENAIGLKDESGPNL